MEELILCNGKYRFYLDQNGILRCNRYGEPWREFIGDNAVLALFRYAVEASYKERREIGGEG